MALDFDSFALTAVLLLGFAALVLLISSDWRLSVSSLGVMYIGVFTLVALSWPLEMAVVKLVTGWICASVLGIGLVNFDARLDPPVRYFFSEILFRFSAASLVFLMVISLTGSVQEWLQDISPVQTFGGLLLIGMGVLHLGFTLQPFRTVVGLLVFLGGFEILYAAIESSVLVAGFLAMINMGLALVGAYLILAPNLEEEV